ncbi:MAG: 1-deoxy-D-xylulose-5-phosphate synthase [Candidatus Cloacimonetes bacterium]|nr:1-deoxy-D-xylulose-5-phosphate synthase [Candidatus Cloacimonadota bacterium]
MILETIKSPDDIRRLNFSQLEQLADEVRQRIIAVTAKTGGHLAPSLGATDIAVSLLKVFDPMKNRVVWDVGHQSYAYKILTGRNEQFDTLRQLGGISGFNNIFESPYDAFSVGHSSTSISAALGISVAEELKNNKQKMIAVIGDGALTGGMSFEALNHAGHLQKELIVILNDNTMSISKNVGALQDYLSNMMVSKSYNLLKKQVWELAQNHLPKKIKNPFLYGAKKLEESLINILVPNIIFEDLGFKYVGPIDGHNIGRMVKILNDVKNNMIGPVLIHVVTQKGKGCCFAEDNSTKFHGVGPYHEKTGESVGKSDISYSEVFGNYLCKLAEKNEDVIAITAAMSEGTGLSGFETKFPDRFFDVGIAEQHSVTFAGGLAVQGFKPFVAVYSTFMQRALDQIIHDTALQKLPVVFCLDRAGIVGEDGATHQGAFDLSYLNFIPNLIVMAPSSAEELEAMLQFAYEYKDGPVAIRYPRGKALYKGELRTEIIPGKFEIMEKGEKIALLGIGTGYLMAEELHKKCKENKLDPWLINARFLKPLDLEVLGKLKKDVDVVVTIEENALIGGFGSSICSYFSSERIPVFSYGLPDMFIPHGKTNELKEMINLTPEKIFSDLQSKLAKLHL